MFELNLITIKETAVDETAEEIIASAVEAPTSVYCLQCGSTDFVKFGNKKCSFKDIPFNKKRVSILLNRQRYRCNNCSRTFFAKLEELDGMKRCTKRLIAFILKEAESRSCNKIAKEIGMVRNTVLTIVKERK